MPRTWFVKCYYIQKNSIQTSQSPNMIAIMFFLNKTKLREIPQHDHNET